MNLAKYIRDLIFLIVGAFWLIIGLILWIPVLVRVILAFYFVILYSMLVGIPDNIQNCRETIDTAMSLYIRGFRRLKILHAAKHDANISKSQKNDSRIFVFIKELAWTLIFWGGTFVLFSPVTFAQYFDNIYPQKSNAAIIAVDSSATKVDQWIYKLNKKANIYSCPSENCNVVYQKTYAGMEIEVLEKHDKWFKVKIATLTGYMRAKNLTYLKRE